MISTPGDIRRLNKFSHCFIVWKYNIDFIAGLNVFLEATAQPDKAEEPVKQNRRGLCRSHGAPWEGVALLSGVGRTGSLTNLLALTGNWACVSEKFFQIWDLRG